MRSQLLRIARLTTQLSGLFLANTYISVLFNKQIYKGPFKGICIPFLYCHACPSATFSCPVGAVQHYMTIHQFPYFLVGHFGLLGLLVGRMTCGWLCPFGLLQDLLYRIKSKKIKIPHAFSMLPYMIVLLLVLLLPYVTSEHWFSKLCPIGTLVAGLPWVMWNPVNSETGNPVIDVDALGILFVIKLVILGGFLHIFVTAKRPFCRYICPVGLFLSFFNKISILKLKVSESCNKCDTCQKKCPMDIKVYEDPNARDCIRCLECTTCEHVSIEATLPGCRPTAVNTEDVTPLKKEAL